MGNTVQTQTNKDLKNSLVKQGMNSADIGNHFNETTDDYGNTPVMQAIIADDRAAFRKLLDYKTNPKYKYNIDFNKGNKVGLTPIVVAAQQIKDNRTDGFIGALCRVGIEKSINSTDSDGNTPFMIVLMGYDKPIEFNMNNSDDTRTYDILLNCGADINQGNNQGTTPLIEAIKRWAKYKNYETPFEFVKFLLEKGADVNKPDNNGMTPLIAAVKLGKVGTNYSKNDNDMIRYLTRTKEANINILDNEGKPALYWAKKNGRDTKWLLESNESVKATKAAEARELGARVAAEVGRRQLEYGGSKRKSNKKRKFNKKRKSNKKYK
jgi:ankyrin repeat protein